MASQQLSTLTSTPAILSSPIISVIADHGTAHFFVHAATLTAHSPPLHRALTGPWRESSTHRIELPEWDGPTVSRFLQYLYINSYTLDAQDATPLLSHAKIYALADYKDVPALRALSLSRLSHALAAITWDDAAVADAVELIDYVYTHTRSGEAIRSVVSRFALESLECLMISEDMEALLGKGGDFTVELMRVATAREEERLQEVLQQREALEREREGKHHICEANQARIQALEDRVQDLEVRRTLPMSPAQAQRAAAARMSGVRRGINALQIR